MSSRLDLLFTFSSLRFILTIVMALRLGEVSRHIRTLASTAGLAGIAYSLPEQVNFLLHPGPIIANMDPGLAVVAEGLPIIAEAALIIALGGFAIAGGTRFVREVATAVRQRTRRSGPENSNPT